MRENTPPSSPFFERDDMNDVQEMDDDGEDDELIYVGDGKYRLCFEIKCAMLVKLIKSSINLQRTKC